MIERLDNLLPDLKLKQLERAALERHKKTYPRMPSLRLTYFWMALHLLVAGLGVVITILILACPGTAAPPKSKDTTQGISITDQTGSAVLGDIHSPGNSLTDSATFELSVHERHIPNSRMIFATKQRQSWQHRTDEKGKSHVLAKSVRPKAV